VSGARTGVAPGQSTSLPEGMASPGGLSKGSRRRGRAAAGQGAGGAPLVRMPSSDEVKESLAAEDERWTRTLKKAIPSVVVIQTHSLNNLEGESSPS